MIRLGIVIVSKGRMKLLKKIMGLGSKLLGGAKKGASASESKKRGAGVGKAGQSGATPPRARGKGGKSGRDGKSDKAKTRGKGGRESDSSARVSEGAPQRGGRKAADSRSASGRAASRRAGGGRAKRGEGRERDLQNISVKPRIPKSDGELPAPKSLDELDAAVAEFVKLGLNEKLLSAVADAGYVSPTPIQRQAIPEALKGSDIIGMAQTGTGKTAAFALPILQMMDADGKESFAKARVLVLSPTRELATQTAQAFKTFSKYLDIETALIQGGVAMRPQAEAVRRGAEVIVATPGRLLDFIRQSVVSLGTIKYLVLDEVDRMFDMGFIEDVSNIIRYCPKERQTLFFSATMPEAVMRLSEWALKDPVVFENGSGMPAETIEHFVYPVDSIQKYDMLIEFLKSITFDSLIVFTRTRIDADRISEWLLGHGYKVSTLHSDRTQGERDRALRDFKEGRTAILVATDIASRGLDISNVGYVINYNVPEHAEDYVHRIGRTGRANRDGTAVTFFASEETEFLRRIEALINARIERRKLEGFRYRNEPILEEAPKRAKRRNR